MQRRPSFTVGLVQSRVASDPDANREAMAGAVRAAADRGAQIICLQELFATPYFCQEENAARFDLAEPVPGPSTELAVRLARELEVVLVVPVFERRAPGLYHNSAVVIDADGTELGTYRKMHVPDDPQYYEKFYFTPGDLGYRVFETRYASVGVLICWDQWYPEAARLTALQGAELIVYPTAIGWLPEDRAAGAVSQPDAWRTVQRGHAIANGVFVAAINRVGRETVGDAEIEFWGQSFLCDPAGRVMVQAPSDVPETLVARCERSAIEEQRRGWPFLRDRRIDSYGSLTRRYLDPPSVRASDPDGA